MGIMHRDIKPHNILINPATQDLRIVDWGLSEFYFHGKDYNPRVSTRYFKAPELLLNYSYYDYSIDVWSMGVMIAGIIFKKEPFFQGADIPDQLIKIVKVLGFDEFREWTGKYKIKVDKEVE